MNHASKIFAWTWAWALTSLCTMVAQGEVGAAAPPNALALDRDKAYVDTRTVPEGERASALPEGWDHGAFMEIFVRAYRDSDGDGHGDLRGLTQSLDYLQELGVHGIWLMPVTGNADGDHGYAPTDFRNIAPEYGTLADFDELLRQAHRRGIGVIMDYVINHSSAQHPMFVQALKGPSNSFHDWYVWSDTAPAGWDIWGKYPWYRTASQPWLFKGDLKTLPAPAPGDRGFYFGTFGPHMPDFNFRNPLVLEYHVSSLRFWLNRGLDGYRLDAVPHLIENSAKDWNDQPESRALTKQFQDLIKRYQHRAVVCEATANPRDYGEPALCGGAFAFGYTQSIVKAAQGDAAAARQVAEYYSQAPATMATFLSNHDIFAGKRLWDQMQGDVTRYKLAAATYLLQPGTPFIYYGEEVGMAGLADLPGDMPLRGPMSWTSAQPGVGFTTGQPFRAGAPNAALNNVAAQRADPASIFNFYKAMLALRNGLPSLARGSYAQGFVQGLAVGWQRRFGDELTQVLINYGTQAETLALPGLPPRADLARQYPIAAARLKASAQGRLTVILAPQSVQVWKVLPVDSVISLDSVAPTAAVAARSASAPDVPSLAPMLP